MCQLATDLLSKRTVLKGFFKNMIIGYLIFGQNRNSKMPFSMKKSCVTIENSTHIIYVLILKSNIFINTQFPNINKRPSRGAFVIFYYSIFQRILPHHPLSKRWTLSRYLAILLFSVSIASRILICISIRDFIFSVLICFVDERSSWAVGVR